MSLMFGSLNIFSLGSEEGEISVDLAGKTNIKVTQKVPKGIKRIFTFGNIMTVGGAARNYQIFSAHEKSGKRYPISPNDSTVKGMEGMQIMNEEFVLEVDVAAAADVTRLAWSISYLDVSDPVRRR